MSAARTRLTVDLDALAANYALFKRMSGPAEVAPVVKADAYGLGAGPVARRLWGEGARSFHVARLEEGEALRGALGPARDARIFVLDGCPPGAARRLIEAVLIPVLNTPAQLETYAALARPGAPLPCALHLDTGMHRLGFQPEALAALVAAPDRLDRVRIELVMSHLACADDAEDRMNPRQLGHFRRALAHWPQAAASLANSSGVFLGAEYLFDMTRPGVGLYGGGPFGRPHPHIRPVARLEAPILQIVTVPEGGAVGYGAAFIAEAPRRAGIIAAGYADGVLRSFSPAGRVWFDGAPRPVLGRVSMDLMAVDLSDCAGAAPGAMVELLGPDALLDDAAAAAGTVSYELLTRLGPRADRVYLGEVD